MAFDRRIQVLGAVLALASVVVPLGRVVAGWSVVQVFGALGPASIVVGEGVLAGLLVVPSILLARRREPVLSDGLAAVTAIAALVGGALQVAAGLWLAQDVLREPSSSGMAPTAGTGRPELARASGAAVFVAIALLGVGADVVVAQRLRWDRSAEGTR